MIDTLFSLNGRSALITGAAGTLGNRSARVLARLGAKIFISDHPSEAQVLNKIANDLRSQGVDVEILLCDVTKEQDVTKTFEHATVSQPLDVFVNLAGIMLRKGLVDTSLEEWQRVIDVNLTGTWLLNRAAAKAMGPVGSGKIINFSSVYAERVGPVPESAYYASKAGIGHLTRSVASELGASGVTVNCLALGVFYPTQMTAPLKDSPDTLKWFSDRTMLGRLGDPEVDLDGPLVLLATQASNYITGQIIYVDGGWSAW